MKTRKIHMVITLSTNAKAALCRRAESEDRSTGAVVRDAVAARYRRETGADLPTIQSQKCGRRTTNPEQMRACVLLTPEWLALLQAHAPGKTRTWIAETVTIFLGFTGAVQQQREDARSRPKAAGLGEFIRQCEAKSIWPSGRAMMRGDITGRLYLGCVA